MTKTEKLFELIDAVVKREVTRQLAEFKKQILSEIKRSSLSSTIERRGPSISEIKQPVFKKPNVRPKYSNNPLLNDLLSSTMPMEHEPRSIVDESGKAINYVTEDSNGRPVNVDNPAVQGVLEAMNRDYSSVIAPTKPNKPVSQIKQSSLAAILSPDVDDVSGMSIPDPFSEKDW